MTDPLRDRVIVAVGEMFDIQEELGRGGMSVVYRALDLRLHWHVAIKVLPPEFAFRPEVRSRFLREAETAAQLSHPNIVPIYSVDEREGLVYFVMACVDGETLGAHLAGGKQMRIPNAVRMLGDVADALAYAHAHGVVHRDVKPENILLDRESGRAMVTDFGIARAAEADSRLTATGIAVGTPAYMSPEQALGDRELDGRSDLYALGVVAYRALAGVLPFEASNTPAMMMKHVTEPVRALRERRPDVPAALEHAITRALAKRPDDRWADVAAFRAALTAGAPSRPHARAPAPAPPSMRPGAPAAAAGAPSPPLAAPAPRAPWEHHRLERSFARYGYHGRETRRERRDAFGALPLDARIRIFRGNLLGSGFAVLGLAFVNFFTSPFFPWFVFPAAAMGGRLSRQWNSLWSDGVRWGRIFHSDVSDEGARAVGKAAGGSAVPRRERQGARRLASERGLPPTEEEAAHAAARELAPAEVLRGAHGEPVVRAASDRRAIMGIVNSLAEADRSLIPDVVPTANALTQRVAALAQMLHQLDADLSPEATGALERRIAHVEAEPEDAADRERRLALLRRQRATIEDLRARRARVAAQLESAGIALQNLRLDLLKLRSAGVQAALSDVTSATMEARALSRDIGYVLDAAAEIRDL